MPSDAIFGQVAANATEQMLTDNLANQLGSGIIYDSMGNQLGNVAAEQAGSALLEQTTGDAITGQIAGDALLGQPITIDSLSPGGANYLAQDEIFSPTSVEALSKGGENFSPNPAVNQSIEYGVPQNAVKSGFNWEGAGNLGLKALGLALTQDQGRRANNRADQQMGMQREAFELNKEADKRRQNIDFSGQGRTRQPDGSWA